MTLLNIGDKVIVREDVYLGRWIRAGEQGIIVRTGDNEGQTLYHVDIEGVHYSFVRSELEMSEASNYKFDSEGSSLQINPEKPIGSSIIITGEDGLADLLRIIRATWAEGRNVVFELQKGGRVIFNPDKPEAK